MRVVWIYKSAWKKPGPIVYMGLLNAMACASRGAKTDLFVAAGKASDVATDLREFYGVEPDPRLQIHRVEAAAGLGGRLERPVYGAARRHLDAALSRGEEVLAVTREVGMLPPLLRLRRRHRGLLVIHEAHDFYGRIDHLPVRRLSDYRRWLAERIYIPRTDGLLCITDAQRKLYGEVFRRLPSICLPLGCVEPRGIQAPDTRRGLRRLGYIGHMHGTKGYTLLVEAAAQLRAHGVTVQCYGGYPTQVKRLTADIAGRGLTDTIRLEPFHSPVEMLAWLAGQVSVGVAALQDTFYNRNLTCPVKVLDFLSQGLPVVGSDLPSVTDLAGPAGVYHRPDDVAGFVEAVLGVLDDPGRYSALSRQSLERARALAWPNRASALLDFAAGLRPGF
jgi:glycosyltransferase involved in cell wall biosynthesis